MSAPHLSAIEERRLFDEYRRTGDKKLEERLLRSQLGLVGMLTHQYRPFGIEYEDLHQEGVLGLLQAIRRFDPARGVRLATYAGHWIRAYEFQYVIGNFRLVRLGTTEAQRRIFFRVAALRARLSAAGLEPTAAQLASLMRVDERAVVETESRMGASEVSLDAPIRDDGRRRYDGLAATSRPADELLADAEVMALVCAERDRFRATLSPRGRTLFDARWMAEDAATQREMSRRIGISRERVRQLEERMLTDLRKRVRGRLAA